MRTETEITEELERVRARRRELFPTQSEPLDSASPLPAGFAPDAPGGEITELLATEARLVLERAEVRRSHPSGEPTTSPDTGTGGEDDERDEVRSARRILQRIDDGT